MQKRNVIIYSTLRFFNEFYTVKTPKHSNTIQNTNNKTINRTGDIPFFNIFVQIKNKINPTKPGNSSSKSD